MKIERINDNQIRCFLSREDLANRQMKISELAYGTEKARNLFNDMMSFARKTYGFRADDNPLMIEAVPLSFDTILLTITKVAYPENMDLPFDGYDEDDFGEDLVPEPPFFGPDFPDLPDHIAADDIIESYRLKSPFRYFSFNFSSLNDVIAASKSISNLNHCDSKLYKTKDSKYYLMISPTSNDGIVEFNNICNQLAEYGVMENNNSHIENIKIKEHAKLIMASHALEDLALL